MTTAMNSSRASASNSPINFSTSSSCPTKSIPLASTSKTSLGFICSPQSVAPLKSVPPAFTIVRSLNATLKVHKRSRFENLPRDIHALVAFHLVVDDNGLGRHPALLIPLFLTSRVVYDSISFDNNPQLYNKLFRATFDTSALDRRYNWMVIHLADMAGRGRKIFDLFSDPRSWAIDYKTRWDLSWRMREVVRRDTLEIPGVCDKDQLAADHWNVWFILTENDGRNARFLATECRFQEWVLIYYRQDAVEDSILPGYPRETGTKALAVWICLLSGLDGAGEETPSEVDEKIFLMRPFVFACAKYDSTYAPWHHRKLPLCPPTCREHEPDVTLRSKALPYKRFGYTWRRAPPHLILACYLFFLRLLERHPSRMGIKSGSSTFSLSPGEDAGPGLFSTTHILPSIYHDREWQRNAVCQDPHTSPGLPPLTFQGEVQGFWRAKFLFYDFDMYRQILAGNLRAVYTGTFAEQAAELELKETVIKIRADQVGGDGPLLTAGFIDEEGENASEREQERIEAGYGHEVVTNMDEPDEPGWIKEILITGCSRTSWGWAFVRGRVRAWDGLVILAITYSRHVMGRWLWRGYLHTGGHLIGRWRDTFTPEHLRGYEGAFGMIRAGDMFYPRHYPRSMSESIGVDSSGVAPGAAVAQTGAGALAFPSQSLVMRPWAAANARAPQPHQHAAQVEDAVSATRTTLAAPDEDTASQTSADAGQSARSPGHAAKSPRSVRSPHSARSAVSARRSRSPSRSTASPGVRIRESAVRGS